MADEAVVSAETKLVPEEKPAPKRLPERDFQMDVSYAYPRASVTLPVGWTFQECLKPEFWVSIAPKFSKDPLSGRPDFAGATIEVRTLDHAFYAELYVRAVMPGGLVVGVLKEPVYFAEKVKTPSGYEVRWNVGKREFDIIRNEDREVVGSRKTKEAAVDWISSLTGKAA